MKSSSVRTERMKANSRHRCLRGANCRSSGGGGGGSCVAHMVGDYDAPHDAPREKPLSPSNVEVRLTSCVVPHSPFQALPGFRSDLVPAEDGPAAACCKVLQLATDPPTDRPTERSFVPSFLPTFVRLLFLSLPFSSRPWRRRRRQGPS